MSHAPCAAGSGAPKDFYENLSRRTLHPHTLRGILYRNLVVARHVRGPRVLEVGPGEGMLTGILSARGLAVTAVDLARGWLAALPPEGTAGRAMAGMTALPFADAVFDTVVAAEVVEHIPDLAGALAEAARVLRPGGELVLTVPYREVLRPVTCPHCGGSFEPNGHVHTFDEETLAGALRGAGLAPGRRFVGPTRVSREILRRAPIRPLLPVLTALDRVSYRTQRVTDTWMLMTARRR